MKRCRNDVALKAAEVADGMQRFGGFTGMTTLYNRGCFRHLEDVAYARIALERFGSQVEVVGASLDATYEELGTNLHRCDRVFPPA